MLLLSLEIRELKRYFATFPDDALWIRAYILLMVCADVVCMYGGCGAAYTYLVVGWGDLSSLQVLTVNFIIYEASMAVGMILLHLFLIRRFFVLSHNHIASFLLCLPAGTTFIAGLVVTYLTGVFKQTSDRPRLRTTVTIFSLSSSVVDTIIAAAMMYQLHRVQSPFNRTDGLVRRLMRNTILSGATTGVFALATFLAFNFIPLSNIVLIFSFNISRVGTLTVLYNLNDRRRARDQLEATEITVPADELYHDDEAQTNNTRPIQLPTVSGSRDVFDSKGYTV
ncbi:hypothetical protein BKA62DRAFT_775725 [Auriculariales sp. MPI-PUGE-AT-0066]|nr:hypothetical protein BKA62DRAFT_775725 [Auriculariales sp. MPI-PUGE-AT-0066]